MECQELGWIPRKEGNFRRGGGGRRAGGAELPTRGSPHLACRASRAAMRKGPGRLGNLLLGQLQARRAAPAKGIQGQVDPQGRRVPGPLGPPRQTRSESSGGYASYDSLTRGLDNVPKRGPPVSLPRLSLFGRLFTNRPHILDL